MADNQACHSSQAEACKKQEPWWSISKSGGGTVSVHVGLPNASATDISSKYGWWIINLFSRSQSNKVVFPRIAESSHALIAYRDLAFVAPPAMGFTTLTITLVVLSVAGLGTPCSAAFVAPRAGLGTLIATLHAQARWKVLAPSANPFPAFVAKYHASFALPGRASVATHPGRASVAITIKVEHLELRLSPRLTITLLKNPLELTGAKRRQYSEEQRTYSSGELCLTNKRRRFGCDKGWGRRECTALALVFEDSAESTTEVVILAATFAEVKALAALAVAIAAASTATLPALAATFSEHAAWAA